jgi:uncharacterized protein YbaR (Trm112 family)
MPGFHLIACPVTRNHLAITVQTARNATAPVTGMPHSRIQTRVVEVVPITIARLVPLATQVAPIPLPTVANAMIATTRTARGADERFPAFPRMINTVK